MKLILWLAYLPLDILSSLASYLLAPFIVLLSESTARRYFRWFLTPDNPITGDESHERRWAGKPVYLKKIAWLWRNKAYGFSKSVIGADTKLPAKVWGNPEVTDKGPVEGIAVWWTVDGYWQFYYIKKMPWRKVLRMNLGWKLWGDGTRSTDGMYVFTINPVKSFD